MSRALAGRHLFVFGAGYKQRPAPSPVGPGAGHRQARAGVQPHAHGDIAGTIFVAMGHRDAMRLLNLADDLPAASADVLDHAAAPLGVPRPPRVALDEAGLPPVAEAFRAENRRLRNHWLKVLPGFSLGCPSYREGLAVIRAEETREREMADAM